MIAIHNLSSFRILSKFIKQNVYNIRRYSFHSPVRILFFGSDNIALSSLKKINELRNTSKLINTLDLVTANAAKHSTIVEKYAQSENINIVKWPLERLEHGRYDIGLIVAFGHMIKKDLLEKFPLGMVNVHPSLLPRWRGAAPIIHTLLYGDQETGVTLMRIKADKFDVGEIISQIKVEVPSDIKLPDLTAQLSEYGADMLVECVKTLPDCLVNAKPQSDLGVTYARKINKDISDVRWCDMNAIQVYNLHRAIYNLYALSTRFRDKQVKLFDASIDNINTHIDGEPGSVKYCDKTSMIDVKCKDSKVISFKSLRIVGKRKITAIDFHNGYLKNRPDTKCTFY